MERDQAAYPEEAVTDTEFASAPYVLHQHQMALIRAAEAIGALEKRVDKLEAQLAGIGDAFSRADKFEKAIWGAPMTLPPAPATDTDPAA